MKVWILKEICSGAIVGTYSTYDKAYKRKKRLKAIFPNISYGNDLEIIRWTVE
jgi:hypothetical protein